MIFTQLAIFAQNSKHYDFEVQPDSSTSVKFSVSFPETWSITSETEGTPFALIGFEIKDQISIELNNCSPDMRIGISVLPIDIESAIESIGLFPQDNNFYSFKDTDGYISIIVVTEFEIPNGKSVYFRIRKLSTCDSESKKKSKNRNTRDKTYVLYSNGETTICMESFNGVFDENTKNLLESTFNFEI